MFILRKPISTLLILPILILLLLSVTGFSGHVVSEYAADEEVVEESQSHQSLDIPGAGLIAYLNTEGNVALISPDGHVETQITFDAELNRDEEGNFTSGTGYCCLAWSPDGQILAYIQDSTSAPEYQRILTLWLYQIADESYRKLIAMEWISGFAWSSDSRQIVYGLPVAPGIGMPNTDIEDTADGLWLIDITTEASFEFIEAIRDLPLVEPNWSPDGRFLSFRQPSYFGTGALVIYELDSKIYIPWDGGYGDYTWSPDGQKIVYDELFYAQEPRMRLWQADPWGNNRIALTPAEPNSFDHSPRFSPTGNQIAFQRVIDPMGISSRTLWLMNADGSDIHRLTSFEDINQFVWSPDGQQLIVGRAQELHLVDLESSEARFLTETYFLPPRNQPAWQPIVYSIPIADEISLEEVTDELPALPSMPILTIENVKLENTAEQEIELVVLISNNGDTMIADATVRLLSEEEELAVTTIAHIEAGHKAEILLLTPHAENGLFILQLWVEDMLIDLHQVEASPALAAVVTETPAVIERQPEVITVVTVTPDMVEDLTSEATDDQDRTLWPLAIVVMIGLLVGSILLALLLGIKQHKWSLRS